MGGGKLDELDELDELGNVDGGSCEGGGVDGDDEGNGDDVGEYKEGKNDRDYTMFLCNSLNSFSNSLNSVFLTSLYILLLKS